MTFWAILILMVLTAGIVAYVGDTVAKRVGKRHWRPFGLRPRTTGTLVAIATGVLIALGGFGTFFLLVKDARETILQAEQVRQERNRLRTEVERLESRAASVLFENEQLKTEREEFESNNKRLAAQLEQYAQQQQQTRLELENSLAEFQKLSVEADALRASSQTQRSTLAQLEQDRNALLAEKNRLSQEKAQLQADKQRLQAEKNSLQNSRAEAMAQTQKAEAQLRNLETASREALTRYNTLQSQAKALQTRTQTLQARTKELQARTEELQSKLAQLEADKRNLEGDVAVLVAGARSSEPSATASLEEVQKENETLRARLTAAQLELQALRERGRVMSASLDKSLSLTLLAEQTVEGGNGFAPFDELVRRADGKVRLMGLRGVEVAERPSLESLKPGLLVARALGLNPDGKVRIKVEYRLKEQLFADGEVLATTGFVLPISPSEMRRKINSLNQSVQTRLKDAGWIPEKIAQGGISWDEFANLATQLSGRRGGARVGIVALGNLYPTEPPRLGLRVLP